MRITKRLLVSSALWAAPLALGVSLLYFFLSFGEDYRSIRGEIGYAPEIVSLALNPGAALAYAAASALSAWESGRLKASGVWELAPVRSRYRIAAYALLPVLALSWAMVLLPAAGGLIQEDTAPILACIPPLAMTMAVAAAHCVIGFAVGRVLPSLVAAPVLAMGTFYAVAASASSGEVLWPRHLSGQLVNVLPFGTTLPWKVAAPPLLFVGGIAVGAALLWAVRRSHRSKVAVSCVALVVAVAGMGTAYGQVRSWGASAPLSVGHAEMTCAGSAPRVCVPTRGNADAAKTRGEILSTARTLTDHGVRVRLPHRISDGVINGAHEKKSTTAVWWLPLTASQRKGSTRYEVLRHALNLPCDGPGDATAANSAALWAAEVVGEQRRFSRWLRGEMLQYEDGREQLHKMRARVADVRKLSRPAQARWYAAETKSACAPSGGR